MKNKTKNIIGLVASVLAATSVVTAVGKHLQNERDPYITGIETHRESYNKKLERESAPLRQNTKQIQEDTMRYIENKSYGTKDYKIKNEKLQTDSTNKIETLEKKIMKEHIIKTDQAYLSDSFFENTEYLSEKQIKEIFESNNSCLKNKGVEKIIIKYAKENKINPALIVARLQTEQGLITRQEPPTDYQLDYAMGYGDLETGKLPSEGLEFQIRKGSETFRKLYDSFDGKPLKIDKGKKIVQPENAATHAIYRYTPFTHGSNLSLKVLQRYADL